MDWILGYPIMTIETKKKGNSFAYGFPLRMSRTKAIKSTVKKITPRINNTIS